jgi:hypothetical protein
LAALCAAEQLQPDSLPRLATEEFAPALRLILQQLPAADFPSVFSFGLVRRQALIVLREGRPSALLRVCWPWPWPGGLAVSQTMPQAFDPEDPCLHQIAISLQEKVAWGFQFLINDALVKLMSQREAGRTALLLLGTEVMQACSAASESADMPNPILLKVQELQQTFAAVTAVTQRAAVSQEQLRALSDLKDKSIGLAASLSPVLQDTWWASQLQRVWLTAAAEGVAHPMMLSIMQTLNNDLAAVPGSSDVDAAWTKAQRRLPRWRQDLREGSTEQVEESLRSWLQRSVKSLTSDSELESEGEAWVNSAEATRSRIVWFRDNMSAGALEQELRTLVEILTKVGASQKMSTGIQLLTTLLLDPRQETVIESLLNSFKECQGLQPDASARETMREALAALEEHASHTVTAARADLALVLLDMLAHISSSSANSPAAASEDEAEGSKARWQRTSHGCRMLILADTLHGMKFSDAVARLSVKENLRLWEETDAEIFGDSTDMEAAARKLHQWLQEARSHLQKELLATATQAVEALEALAGGAPDGGSWRSNLADGASWEDVEREALYFLFPPKMPTVATRLEELFGPASAVLKEMKAAAAQMGEVPDAALVARIEQAILRARVTCTESFLINVFTKEPVDRRGGKIRNRIVSMAKYGIEEDFIHPALWQRAKTAASS